MLRVILIGLAAMGSLLAMWSVTVAVLLLVGTVKVTGYLPLTPLEFVMWSIITCSSVAVLALMFLVIR